MLTTKYTLNVRPDEPHAGGTHTKSMSQARETSLRRLGTDSIDLYWVHAWDFLTPVDEVMRALNDAVRAGRVCRRRAAQRLGLPGGCRTGSHPGQVAASAAA